MTPPAARVPIELLKLVEEFRNRLIVLEKRTPEAGPAGDDADCDEVLAKLELLTKRVELLERMLTPDASGRMTGLPPFWATFRDVETGEEWTAKVHLGDGFRDTPPKKLTPSLRGEGQ